MGVDLSHSFVCVLLLSTNIVGSENNQENCTFLKVGQCKCNSTVQALSMSAVSCNDCYSDMLGNINTSESCFSCILVQLSENCFQCNSTSMLETHNQTLCILNTNKESGRTSGEMGPSGEVMRLPVILGSLLGITTLLLAANIGTLVICVTANVRLKHKLKQFERSHSRLNRHRKEEHTIHNPVYCDTELKPKEPQKRVHLSDHSREGKYSLAGPGMPYEVADIEDF